MFFSEFELRNVTCKELQLEIIDCKLYGWQNKKQNDTKQAGSIGTIIPIFSEVFLIRARKIEHFNSELKNIFFFKI